MAFFRDREGNLIEGQQFNLAEAQATLLQFRNQLIAMREPSNAQLQEFGRSQHPFYGERSFLEGQIAELENRIARAQATPYAREM